MCLTAKFLLQSFPKNGKFHTIMIYAYLDRSICFSVRLPTWCKFILLFKWEFSYVQWHDAPLIWERQVWICLCKQKIPIDFNGENASLWDIINQIQENISWYIESEWFMIYLYNSTLTRISQHPIQNS